MMFGRLFVAALVATSLFLVQSALAERYVWDLPESKNTLVNTSIEFLKNNPEKSSFEDFRGAFADYLRTAPNKYELYESLILALEQISLETQAGMATKLKTRNYGDYIRGSEGSAIFSLTIAIRDQRLRNMAESFALYQGLLGIPMTQLHTLSTEEFARFSDRYLASLKSSVQIMAAINEDYQKVIYAESAAEYEEQFKTLAPEKLSGVLDAIKKSSERKFNESYKLNTMPAARLLADVMFFAQPAENRNLDEASQKSQLTRSLHLVKRALAETSAFTPAQREYIEARANQVYQRANTVKSSVVSCAKVL